MARRIGVRLAVLAIGVGLSAVAGIAQEVGGDLTGTWTFFVNQRPPDGRLGRLQFKQDGEKLTGKAVLPNGQSQEIQEGRVTMNQVSFVIQFRPDGPRIHHSGEVAGDTIKGMTEFERPGEPKRPHFKWEAQRVAE